MKALKGLVAFLGLLLVIGLGVLGYGLYTKAHVKGAGAGAAAAVGSAPVLTEFGTVQVPLPAGSKIEQMSTAGERVVLRLSGGGPERLLVIDPGQGRIAGQFVLTPEPSVR
jgi:hypothetical protein